jgi:hypothetical protein
MLSVIVATKSRTLYVLHARREKDERDGTSSTYVVMIVVSFVQRMLGGCNVASVEAAHSATARAGNVPLIRVSAAEIISAIVADPRKAACVSLERKGVSSQW